MQYLGQLCPPDAWQGLFKHTVHWPWSFQLASCNSAFFSTQESILKHYEWESHYWMYNFECHHFLKQIIWSHCSLLSLVINYLQTPHNNCEKEVPLSYSTTKYLFFGLSVRNRESPSTLIRRFPLEEDGDSFQKHIISTPQIALRVCKCRV